jgi:hypothetical protein
MCTVTEVRAASALSAYNILNTGQGNGSLYACRLSKFGISMRRQTAGSAPQARDIVHVHAFSGLSCQIAFHFRWCSSPNKRERNIAIRRYLYHAW